MTAKELIEAAKAIDPIEAALLDMARGIQLTPTMHADAEGKYEALARHVDRPGSPLEDQVEEVYPSGSFAIHAAIRSKVKRDQHDVDAVVELSISPDDDPQNVLDRLYEAIVNTDDKLYRGLKVERNSRCVTVHYSDGVTVDLMPVVRLVGKPPRVAKLFHHKPETGETYTKEVNPAGFAEHFNQQVAVDLEFARRFEARRLMADGKLTASEPILVEKADTQPMPEHVPLERKSPRIVALQLLKCFRDKRYRKHGTHVGRRKPPSIIMAALALESPPVGASLTDEVLTVATTIRDRIVEADRARRLLEVRNPAHFPDVFTDRWPEDHSDQRLWAEDLRHFIEEMSGLRRRGFDPVSVKQVFDDLFGSRVSDFVLEEHAKAQNQSILAGSVKMSQDGRIHSPAMPNKHIIRSGSKTAGSVGGGVGLIIPARSNTNMGGEIPDK